MTLANDTRHSTLPVHISAAEAETSLRRRFAWWIFSLLFAGSVLNYVDRAVLGVVMPQIRQALSLTNTDYGLVVNAFLIMYMIFYVLGGRFADRLGCRRSFSLNVTSWSVASALHAFAQGFASLCAFRALLGVAEGGFYPTAMRGVAEWFRQENRAKAVGLLICGLSVGTLVTPPLVAWITLRWGWRAAFLFTGALGFLLVPPWLFLQRRVRRRFGTVDPTPAFLEDGPRSQVSEELPWREVLKRRKYWCVLGARAITDAVWYFYLFWLPGYFQEIRRFDLAMVGRFLWIPFFAGDLGAIGGAWTSSALIRHGWGLDRGRKIVLVSSALVALAGAAVCYQPSGFQALGLASVGVFGYLSWSANLQTVITEITPKRHVAMLYGITGAAGTLMGALSQPLIGRVVDRHGYNPAFITLGVILMLAIALLLLAGKIERIGRAQGVPEQQTIGSGA